jgi:DNA-binding Xre family transcriptional regulator
MGETNRSPRSLRVNKENISTVKEAFACSRFRTQKALGKDMEVAQSTISKFLKGESIDKDIFLKICNRLELDWQKMVQPPDDTKT